MQLKENYQLSIELNHEQDLAFKSLQRAFNKCRKANVFFYQNLEVLGALNGNNVVCVNVDTEQRGSDNDLGFLSYPTVKSTCSFADDSHFVQLHDK